MTRDEAWVLEEKYGGDSGQPGFTEDCHRLAAGEPLAYVIGWQPFLGLKIYLDSRPLIPRPETEWWVDKLLREAGNGKFGTRTASAFGTNACDVASQPSTSLREAEDGRASVSAAPRKGDDACPNFPLPASMRFLDLCAGSGAIGCAALAKLPHAMVYFGEIDAAHEPTMLKNIRLNGLDEARADIGIGDLFEPFAATNFSCPYSDLEKWKYSCGGLKFDIIAANPPYIPSGRTLEASVADYEPEGALRAGDDGLAIIRRIASALPHYLAEGGRAFIECDSEHASDARELFEASGFAAHIRTDQYGVPRVIAVSFP